MHNFHGKHRKKSYFEGWYLKHQAGGHTVAFIPAYHIDENGNKSVSLQIITNSKAYFIAYPAEQLIVGEKEFYIRIGNSVFQQSGLTIDIHEDTLHMEGTLLYQAFRPLKSDIMGPFRFVPHMQCSHGVISKGHGLSGNLTINGITYSFDSGTGYIETDRGSSFPKSYIWTQCNCFQDADCSIMMSSADIPLGPARFRGCISFVQYQGKEYRLATYTGGLTEQYSPTCLSLRQGTHILRATVLEEHPLELRSPINGRMNERIRESAACTIRYEFFAQNRLIFDLTSKQASFEFTKSQERG